MKIHPYRDVIDYNQLLRCQKQRKHFSGVGNVQCILNFDHADYCQWPDQDSWTPQLENLVRVSYPYRNNLSFYGHYGVIENVYSFLKDKPPLFILLNFEGHPCFYKEELELIRNDYM